LKTRAFLSVSPSPAMKKIREESFLTVWRIMIERALLRPFSFDFFRDLTESRLFYLRVFGGFLASWFTVTDMPFLTPPFFFRSKFFDASLLLAVDHHPSLFSSYFSVVIWPFSCSSMKNASCYLVYCGILFPPPDMFSFHLQLGRLGFLVLHPPPPLPILFFPPPPPSIAEGSISSSLLSPGPWRQCVFSLTVRNLAFPRFRLPVLISHLDLFFQPLPQTNRESTSLI